MSRSARTPASYAGSPNQDHKESRKQDNQDPGGLFIALSPKFLTCDNGCEKPAMNKPPASRKPIPWRPIGAAATSIGAPAGLALLHPALGAAAFLTELAVSLIILGTALFGAKEYSERAFRLLRWIADRPEPDAPPENTAGQVIDLVAVPTSRTDDHHRAVKAEIVPVTSSEEGTRQLADRGEDHDATDLRRLPAGT